MFPFPDRTVHRSIARQLPYSLLLCLTAALPAQGETGTGEEPLPQPSAALLARLNFSRVDLDQATALSTELRNRTTGDRLLASKILRDQFLRHQKAFDKLANQVVADFEKAAHKAQRELPGKKGEQQIEQLRAQSLQVSRQADLSKAQIHDDIDPCIKQLRELLLPDLAKVLATDNKLDKKLTELRTGHQELRLWHGLYAAMTEGLELHDDAIRHFKKYPPPNHPGTDQRIDQDLAFAMFAGLAMSASDHRALAENAALRATMNAEEYLGTLQLNEIRYLLGLPLVFIDEKLGNAARDHSHDMHTLGFFSHTSPVAGKQSFGQRAANFGTSASAENIAAGQTTGHGAVTAWWYSPGHHRNMLAGHRRTGLGRHENLWTQMFGG